MVLHPSRQSREEQTPSSFWQCPQWKVRRRCNSCHAGAGKPFIRIQRPTEPSVSNQNFAPVK
jgi:hypothetical protein